FPFPIGSKGNGNGKTLSTRQPLIPRLSRANFPQKACALTSRPPRQTEKAAKCPEPLCPTRVLPPLGRPSPERTLLLRLRSYWLMPRSHWALSSFGFWPRSESPCRL